MRRKRWIGRGSGTVTSSLELRLLIPLILIVCAVLAVHTWFTFRSTRDRYLELVAGDADRSSGLIRRATHDGMLLNRLDDVQATIERLAEGSDVAAIRVYDKNGRIVLSSERAELGRSIPVDASPCTTCHVNGAPASQESVQLPDESRAGGERVLRQLSLIPNEPGCAAAGCHDRSANERVLGVLDVEMSMLPLGEALADARRYLIWTTLVLVLVIGGAAAGVYRRLIHRPIRRLQEGTRRIAEGDLESRIEVEGRHELALLAEDFNRMAEDLARTEKQITEWSHTLEDRVVEKTAELRDAQRQVMHMEKMASLGKLSATVAHEINNPLSGVLTYARLVERELDDQPMDEATRAELVRYLQLVQQETTRCSQIVRNLLVFARRSPTAMAIVDVNAIVERSLMLIRHHMEISGIESEATYLVDDPGIEADAGQLQQALVALFVNAVEAMPGGGRLDVRLRGDAECVRIDIADTGTGISADALPLIFEPFFSTKTGESGVGLGLAVVYGIVHRHGGSIEVESTVGEGTTFHVRFPRTPPPDAEVQAAAGGHADARRSE
jgi:two-component system NtrC family sensor kinase